MLSSLGKYLMTVDMFPVFFFAHFSMGNIIVREDSKHLGPKFRQKHPFVSWFCTLMACMSGVFVANFLFGDPILSVLKENFLIGYLTLIWYLMNHCPFDVFYKVMTHPAIMLPVAMLQECLRARFLYLGIQTTAGLYPKAPMILMVGGIIKGNGYGFLKIVERLIRGHWDPKTNEFLEVTYAAKSAAIASLLFVLHHYGILVKISIEYLYLGVVVSFIIGRLVMMVGGLRDPLAPVLNPFSKVLFGGWDEEKSNKSDSKKNDDRSKEKHNKIRNGDSKKSGDKKTN